MLKANYVFPVEVRGTADPSATLGMTKGRVKRQCKAAAGRRSTEFYPQTESSRPELPWACGLSKAMKTSRSSNHFLWTCRPFLCHPERSRGICSSADLHWKYVIRLQHELSSRPERTRISCHAALDMSACAAFVKESRMKIINATKFNRKSGVA
jgi:hypothetical protein